MDAMGGSQFNKTGEIESNVTKSQDGIGIVEEGHGGGLRTTVIIPGGGEQALLGAEAKFLGKRAKDGFKEDKAGKEGAHRAALRIAFRLQEVLPSACLVEEPADIIGAVDKFKEREKLREVGAERFSAGVTGAGVKHVYNIQSKEDAGLVLGVIDVAGGEKV
jgi:hypothetical protein